MWGPERGAVAALNHRSPRMLAAVLAVASLACLAGASGVAVSPDGQNVRNVLTAFART
jgi:hypothetical protein